MTAQRTDEWSRALGRLPDAQKEIFIQRASAKLEAWAAIAWPQLSQEHVQALLEIAERAEALDRAVARAERLKLPANYLRNAWRETTGSDFPDRLPEALRQVCAAARKWLPDQRGAHRPRDYGVNVLAAMALRIDFEEVFGAAPTVGNGSPYMKFINTAFPAFGLKAPSSQKLRAP